MLDALATTWFGTEDLYVHMINLIPVTSITGELFGVDYVTQEYANIIEPLGEVEMAWRGYAVSDHAIIDPNAAWVDAQELISPILDSALSKSQVMYWISTRKGFNSSVAQTGNGGNGRDETNGKSSGGGTGKAVVAASCESTPACAQTGLLGDCCPTSSGIFLDCCATGK